MSAATLPPTELHRRLESPAPVTVIDVRTPAAFESAHIAGSRNISLDVLRARAGAGVTGGVVLRGGLSDWESNGFDVDRGRQRWELERQVRLVAGSIVLSSVLGSVAVPQLKWVAAAIGGGLTFAAVSNTCAMANALSKLPYNRGVGYDQSSFVAQLRA